MERTKPHVLVIGQVDDEALRDYLGSLGSGVGYAEAPNEVRQRDFDFIIDLGTGWDHWLEGNATVLRFECDPSSGPVARIGRNEDLGIYGSPDRYRIYRADGQRASAFSLMDNSDDRLDYKGLVEGTVLPNIHRGEEYTTIRVDGRTDHSVVPMLAEEDGNALAAIINFPEHRSYWSLPYETVDRLRWMKFFFKIMKTTRPEAFPADQVGLTDDWRTAAEIAAAQAVNIHQAETEAIMVERERERLRLEDQRSAATAAAEEERLLLTAHGDPLTDRVAKVLRKFGFDVEDRDTYAAETQSSKKEDLRITHPTLGGPNWVCLAEVKGFTRGAKANVIQQIQKAAGIFEGVNGNPPSALWYVVNHHRNDPAQTRPKALKSNPDELALFAADNGLVVDTKWLFQLEKRCEGQVITPIEAAQALMDQTGRSTLPVTTDDPHTAQT
ncbi:hypothetical protein [Citricoccus nitrophenolicus]|uniref:hypothetical protein n=1 Tax=Citricoccus nitrophenolicus TaxID=863575 RepID=UPI0031EEE05A